MKVWTSSVFRVVILTMLITNTALAENTAGTVKSLKGEVTILRNGVSVPASVGAALMSEDKISTGADSSVGITLQDGTLLAFGAKSVSQLSDFRYDAVSRDGNMLISVLKGSMRFVTGQIGKHNSSAVSIHTASTSIGIRGTDFIVAVEGGE